MSYYSEGALTLLLYISTFCYLYTTVFNRRLQMCNGLDLIQKKISAHYDNKEPRKSLIWSSTTMLHNVKKHLLLKNIQEQAFTNKTKRRDISRHKPVSTPIGCSFVVVSVSILIGLEVVFPFSISVVSSVCSLVAFWVVVSTPHWNAELLGSMWRQKQTKHPDSILKFKTFIYVSNLCVEKALLCVF